MTAPNVDYVIREGRATDEPFVASSYVNTARMCIPRGQLRRLPDGAFNAYHFGFVQRLLKRCTVRVACNREDEDRLYGFSLVDGHHLHCVYVSKSHWRSGIGRALMHGLNLPETVLRLWPNTSAGSATEWLYPRIQNLTYLPYWLDTEIDNGRSAEGR